VADIRSPEAGTSKVVSSPRAASHDNAATRASGATQQSIRAASATAMGAEAAATAALSDAVRTSLFSNTAAAGILSEASCAAATLVFGSTKRKGEKQADEHLELGHGGWLASHSRKKR
jgi:hypothetical protein